MKEYLKNDCNFPIGIPAAVWKHAEIHADSLTKYCTYLQGFMSDVVERVFAFRRKKGKGLEITEVIRRTPSMEGCVARNIYYTQMGGYHAVYEPKNVTSKGGYYGYGYTYFDDFDFNKWGWERDPGITSTIINMEKLFEIEKYKYCGYSGMNNLMAYLRAYNEDHRVEYFGKLGIAYSPALMKKVKKDRNFIHFLQTQKPFDINSFGAQATIYAYEHKMPIDKARNALYVYNVTCRKIAGRIPEIKGTKIDRMKLDEYLEEQDVGASYNDYLRAIKKLGLDLNDTKNVFPNDFKRMHDLRINEYASLKAKEKAEERKKLNEKFMAAAKKVSSFAFRNDKYSIIIPERIEDLVREGEMLSHCVGRMGYDSKMANGDCVIAFVRLNSELDKPLVTVEYLTKTRRVSQCYAEHDTRPDAEIISFVNDWDEYVKSQTA